LKLRRLHTVAIKPAGHRLVVKPYKQEEVDSVLRKAKESGFLDKFEIINSNKEREDKSVDKGVVVAIGPTAWHQQSLGWEPWCAVGDVILFAKFAPKFVEDPETKELMAILNDEDVVAVIEEKKND
jgi:co-chaperonin GroES (HSP10)